MVFFQFPISNCSFLWQPSWQVSDWLLGLTYDKNAQLEGAEGLLVAARHNIFTLGKIIPCPRNLVQVDRRLISCQQGPGWLKTRVDSSLFSISGFKSLSGIELKDSPYLPLVCLTKRCCTNVLNPYCVELKGQSKRYLTVVKYSQKVWRHGIRHIRTLPT